MEKRVIFYEGMDVDPQDHVNLQTYVQDSVDHVVSDTLTANQRYAGFGVAKSGTTGITVAPGRLYSGGKRYAKDIITSQDFITSLPLVGKKIVSVVVSGNEVNTGETPREFLINEETGASEPRSVAMIVARVASIQFAQGAEAPDPTAPIIDPGYTRIANVILAPTGVESITMLGVNAVENLDQIGDRVDSLEAFEDQAGPKISTLSTDLAKLAVQLKSSASGDMVGRMLTRLAVLEFKNNIPSTAVDSSADYFLSPTTTDLTNPLSDCKISEGIRFADDNFQQNPLNIFDPLNPKVQLKTGGWMFPAYDRQLWLSNARYYSETSIAGYSYQAFEMVQKSAARTRVRYGEEMTICSNAAFFASGVYDYATNTLRRGNEVWEVNVDASQTWGEYLNFDAAGNGIEHSLVRLRRVFYDTTFDTYWDRVTTNHTVNGAQIAETFQQGQDIWLDAIGLYFTRLANTGNVTISICEVTKFGTPNLDSLIMHTTLDRANMRLYPQETVVPINPTFLQAGKRYAILVTTAADHWVGMTEGRDFPQGTFFYVLDGAYAQGDGTRDLMFNLYKSKFKQNRVVVELQPISLAGGMLTLDILADAIVPGATQMTYEIQPQGSGSWYNLFDVSSYILGQGGSLPVTCNLRVVFTGTVDIMPALRLTDSVCRVSRPKTTRRAIGKPRTLAAASNNIHVIERYENWDAANHTATVKLRTGAGYNTVVNPSTYTDTVVATDENFQKWIERHYVFSLGTAVSTYQVQHEATTTSNRLTFHVANRKDYSL